MVKQNVWFVIVVGVFFAGAGVSYAIFSDTYNPSTMKFANQELFDQMISQNPKMTANWMETMMQDAQFHEQAMDYMAKNPEQMNQWMIHDPKHVEEMSIAMRQNHDFMMEMMSVMVNDDALRLQMLGHMTENPEAMEQMKSMTGNMMDSSEMMDSTMEQGMMSGESVDFTNVEVIQLTTTTAIVKGFTDKPVYCEVEYGPVGTFTGSASDNMDMMNMVHNEHEITIMDLEPETSYNYRFKATINEQTFYSDIQIFSTK